MADNSQEQSSEEKTSDSRQSTNATNENGDRSQEELNEEESELNNDIKQEAKTDNDDIENCDQTQNLCSSSEETSPVKTGFLRSFMEKKHLVSQSSEGSENSQDKVESPIEQQVKTTDEDRTSLCKWQDCNIIITSRAELSQHVHQAHVEPMTIQDVFVCLWQGCKVFNKPSCSHSWLAKHMNSHTGDKPFKCMIDSCTMSFASCEGLSRHVAAHFNEPKPVKRQRGENKESPKKLARKRKVKIIRRRRPSEVKEDFVNPKTVESIKQQLPQMMPVCYEIGIDGTKINLHSKVLGRRVNEKSGETDVLLHWLPDELIPDEWVPLNDYEKNKSKIVHLSTLPNHVLAELDPAFYRRMSHRKNRRK